MGERLVRNEKVRGSIPLGSTTPTRRPSPETRHPGPRPTTVTIRHDPARTRRLARALPDLLALHRHDPARYPHLLESAAQSLDASGTSRFDILFAFPGQSLIRRADGLSLTDGPYVLPGLPPGGPRSGAFLDGLDAWHAAEGTPPPTGEAGRLPFAGGWFLALGYELAGEIEPVLRLPPAPRLGGMGRLVALATRMPAAVIRDRAADEVILVAEAGQAGLLDLMEEDIGRLSGAPVGPQVAGPAGPTVEEEEAHHLARISAAVDYIRAGDIFQANISRPWLARLAPGLDHATLYDHLRAANPAPFAGLASWGDVAVISSSPERLVSVRGRRVETRPIAGTRPRGRTVSDDAKLRDELIAHPKERAEHIMLVDLERNDLSRVARPGTVRVSDYMTLETYAHVHHIVSNVTGELRDHVTPGEIIAAVFPGGTITGCPKIRCMEIIAELEATGRGFYTGALGYLDHSGDMDLNILIRTLVRDGQTVTFRAGGGIVADSIPSREISETRAKAKGLVHALAVAGGKPDGGRT